jgi:hypothetical protein
MITKIVNSPLKNKRYRVYLNTGKHYDFGFPNAFTFIDGASENIKIAYQKRHLGNEIEKTLIDNLVPSPSLFSYYLLWGPYRNIKVNAKYLNKLWDKKHNENLI